MEQAQVAKPTIAELADNACAMPWEDKAPFSARYAFKEAVTPELFTELLRALKLCAAVCAGETMNKSGLIDALEAARAAIAKATGSAS